MTNERKTYSKQWRDAVRAGAQSSAAVLAPLIVDRFHPDTAIDVGSGEGWLALELEALDVTTLTVDGPWTEAEMKLDLSIDPFPEPFEVVEAFEKIESRSPYDVAICLEVAEHVAPGRAAELVAWLCSLAPIVVFSAAVPGQGGEGHVNEQWPAYWAELFLANGYAGSGALRWIIWDDARVSWWYRQNLLVFGRRHPVEVEVAEVYPELSPAPPPAVIHPEAWAHKGHA